MSTNNWTANNIPSQKDKTILITGANSGLGLEAATVLAGKGAKVVITARNLSKGNKAVSEIKHKYPKADIELMLLDLADFDSIKQFSVAFHSKHQQLHVLINNAGIMTPPKRETTKQNFEAQFGINHLGHFLLTGLLLDILIKTPNSRIAVQSSIVHKQKSYGGEIYFDDLNFEKSYNANFAYGQSKLANILFAYELDRKLKENKLDTIVTLAHPGVTKTNLQDDFPFLMKFIVNLIAMKAEQGALPILRAATEEDLKGSDFFGPTKMGELKGYPELVKASDYANNQAIAKKLWDVSAKLTGMNYSFVK
jgi:NAD(P)-dependent dehydrogenase (short-subunit alcohol dehydrogenase family)